MSHFLFLNPPTVNQRKITRNCDCASESKGRYLLQPFDLLYLSARIPSHIPIDLLDAVADDLSLEFISQKLRNKTYTHIVMTMADITWNQDMEALALIRREHANAKIYVLGDALIENENIETVLQYANGVITSPFLVEFDGEHLQGVQTAVLQRTVNKAAQEISLGIPRHDLFMNKNYRWPFATHKRYASISSNWGCPYACSYCIDSQFPNIYRPYAEIIQEMMSLKKLGISELNFTDKSFGVPKGNTISLLNEMIQGNFNFSWSTYLHPNQGEKDLLNLMKKAGCHTIIIGIENYELEKLGQYNRRMSSRTLERTLENAKEVGLNVCGDFLIGLNFQNRQDILKNIEHSLHINIDYASFNIAAPLPGSAIKQEAIKDGRMKAADHHYDSVGRGRVLPAQNFSSDELIELRNLAVRKFYLRPGYWIKRLMKLRSFEHLLIQIEEMFSLIHKTLLKPKL